MAHFRTLLKRRLGRMARSEDGTATIPFIMFMPLYLLLVISSLEMGLLMIRHVMLERAVDLAVRDLRLGIGGTPSYDGVKREICNNAGLIESCMTQMHLELRPVSKATWEPLGSGATCINRVEDPNPPVNFLPGISNEMMLIRACVKFKPIFPTTGLGSSMPKDSVGEYALVSSTAFVNEPRPGS